MHTTEWKNQFLLLQINDTPIPEYSAASSTVKFIFFHNGTLDISGSFFLLSILLYLLAFGSYSIANVLR